MKATDIVPFDPGLVPFIRRILSVAETGKPEWDPGIVYIYPDGKNNRRQATVSIGFTADSSNLRKFLLMYSEAGGGFTAAFAPWIAALKAGDPCIDSDFKALVRTAADQDPLFGKIQHKAFEDLYLGPAFGWAKDNGFILPLSFLVIADSFLHSGSILQTIRKKFPVVPPAAGGQEREWTTQYARARHNWLSTHSRPILHATVYRCDCYLAEIKRDNWYLLDSPIVMHGTRVYRV